MLKKINPLIIQTILFVLTIFTTTLDGIIQKEDSTNEEFIVPAKIKELYANKDYGRYADKKGYMPVCFYYK